MKIRQFIYFHNSFFLNSFSNKNFKRIDYTLDCFAISYLCVFFIVSSFMQSRNS